MNSIRPITERCMHKEVQKKENVIFNQENARKKWYLNHFRAEPWIPNQDDRSVSMRCYGQLYQKLQTSEEARDMMDL